MGCCAISSSGAESCSCNLHHSMWGQGSEKYQKHLPFRIPSRGFRWKTSLQLSLHDQVSLAVPLMQYGVFVVYMLTNYQQKGTPCITISQKFPGYLNSCTEILVAHLYVAHHQIWVLWGSNNLLGKDGFTSHQACGCTTPRWWWLLRSKMTASFRSVWSSVHHDPSECINVLFSICFHLVLLSYVLFHCCSYPVSCLVIVVIVFIFHFLGPGRPVETRKINAFSSFRLLFSIKTPRIHQLYRRMSWNSLDHFGTHLRLW